MATEQAQLDGPQAKPLPRGAEEGEPVLSGGQVLRSSTGLAIWGFLLLSVGLYFGYRLATGKSLKAPRPRFLKSGGRAGKPAGPLPTAAARRHQPRVRVRTTVQAIESPRGASPLQAFFTSLARSEGQVAGAITRICHWGDSQIVADNITVTLRRRFQLRFGDSGHGFVSIGKPSSYLHRNIWHNVKGYWRYAGVARPIFPDRRYGLNGSLTYTTVRGPWAWLATPPRSVVGRRVSRFELSYLAHPKGGRFELLVGKRSYRVVDTRNPDTLEDRLLKVLVSDGPHKFTVRSQGHGLLRFYGAVLERDSPGVVYDSLGLKGAQMKDLLTNDAEHFARQLRWRNPNLVVFGFGTNETYGNTPMSTYAKQWTRLLTFIRKTLPQASCLVLGPVDRVPRMGSSSSHARTGPLNRTFRKAALASGCAFWDTYKVMGGPGAAASWRAANLMWGDLAHLNPKGGEKLGSLLFKALMEAYAAWKQDRQDESAPAE